MKKKKLELAVMFIVFTGFVCSSGCIFDPKPDFEPDPGPTINYGDLTDKQHCIDNLLKTYKYKDIEPYRELLHPNYEWFLQDLDAALYNQEIMDRTEDISATDNIFNLALVLELEIIEDGSWDATDTVGTEYWPGSWITTREYFIQAKFPGNDILYSGHDLVEFVVVPVDDKGTTRYKIRIARDIDHY